MKAVQLAELVYDKINLDKNFKECVISEGHNVIKIITQDGDKLYLVAAKVDNSG